MDFDALYRAVMALPTEDRVAFAERLLESVNQTDIDAAWAAEAEARIAAYDQGNLRTVSADEAHRNLPGQKSP